MMPIAAAGRISDENLKLLDDLDVLLTESEEISARQEQKLALLKRQAADAANAEERFWIIKNIFDQYKIYDGDSAMVYGQRTLDIAKGLNRPDLQDELMITSSYTLAAIGLLDQSNQMLAKVNYNNLNNNAKVDYLGQKVYLMTHVDQYNKVSPGNVASSQSVQAVLDSIVSIITPEHPEYHYYLAYQALSTPEAAKEALKKIEPHMGQVEYKTQQDAKLAWVVSQLYALAGDEEGHVKYLTLSAIADMRCANREIASLEELSTLLQKDGDIQRANTYIGHCLKCAELYKNRVRALRVASLQSNISKEYQDRYMAMQQETSQRLVMVLVLALILLCATIYIYMQRRKLQASYKKVNAANAEVNKRLGELSEAYSQLATKNETLLSMSEELKTTNEGLAESDYVKVKCIGSIFAICSQYINKIDDFRRAITRALKTGQYEHALRLTESPELAQNELKEFYEKFDTIFLSVYPDFVEDFNSLLAPDAPILPKKKGSLNTELRIYALVRLGITDSVTIANVLHCSVQTVYNKRMKVRNKAIIDKENFGEVVRTLGKSSRGKVSGEE